MRALVVSVTIVWLAGAASSATAAVERYKDEPLYLARVAELTAATLVEGFESTAWDHVRSDYPSTVSAPAVTSQGLTWEAAAKDLFGTTSSKVHGVTTNDNWSRSGLWGIFESHVGESYPTTIRVSSSTPMYGIGGWFDTNPDGQSVGFLFEDRTTANEPGYVLAGLGAMYPGDNPSVGHEFVGIVDPEGFQSVVLTGTLEINEENVLEGGTIFGADDFTIAAAPLPAAADFDGDGQVDAADLAQWQGDFSANAHSDANGDGASDGYDLLAWQRQFGQGAANQPATMSTPEPASVVLAMIALGGVTAGKRQAHGPAATRAAAT